MLNWKLLLLLFIKFVWLLDSLLEFVVLNSEMFLGW